jgi:hypothetical protein
LAYFLSALFKSEHILSIGSNFAPLSIEEKASAITEIAYPLYPPKGCSRTARLGSVVGWPSLVRAHVDGIFLAELFGYTNVAFATTL